MMCDVASAARCRRMWRGVCMLALATMLTACASNRSGPYAPLDSARRDTALAERLTRDAAEVMATNPAKAETLLRDALAADLYHGPAHNNLGVVYLKMEPPRLYEAASEFEWARKLMPGHPDPRLNLAYTLELAGRSDDAIAGYRAALETEPGHLPTIQALARLQIRCGKEDSITPKLLQDIEFRSAEDTWRTWARRQAIRLESASKSENAAQR